MALENVVITVSRKGKALEKFVADYPNIRTLRGFLDGQWNLANYDSCFQGRNRLGDVDASIELEGYTLLIEFKGARNGMNQGQVLKAIRQAKYSAITTMFIFGKRDKPEGYLTITPEESEKGYHSTGYKLCDMDTITDHIRRWGVWAKKNSLIESKTAEWDEVKNVLGSLYGDKE